MNSNPIHSPACCRRSGFTELIFFITLGFCLRAHSYSVIYSIERQLSKIQEIPTISQNDLDVFRFAIGKARVGISHGEFDMEMIVWIAAFFAAIRWVIILRHFKQDSSRNAVDG
jgi:hypothetical protein